jgi:rubredoxin
MGKKDSKPSDRDVETAKKWEQQQDSFDHYCPKCGVSYPSSSTAHAGH